MPERRAWLVRVLASIQLQVFCFGSEGVETTFFLDFHVPELIGVENLSAVQAFNKLHIILAGHDAHLGVFAGGRHVFIVRAAKGPVASIVAPLAPRSKKQRGDG